MSSTKSTNSKELTKHAVRDLAGSINTELPVTFSKEAWKMIIVAAYVTTRLSTHDRESGLNVY